jgi:hypothetical protein
MQEFAVPMLDPMSSPDDAFARMLEAGRSGVAIQVGMQVRLLPFDALVDAVEQSTSRLVDIGGFEPVTVFEADLQSDAYFDTLNKAGAKFGIIEVRETARLLSSSEGYAGVYLTAPQVLKCRNPTTPHYYPPQKRNPPNRTTCQVCLFPLP